MAAPPPPEKAARLDPETGRAPAHILADILSCSALPLKHALRCGLFSTMWRDAIKEMVSLARELDLGSEFAQGLSREAYCGLVERILDLHKDHPLGSAKFFYLLRPDDDLGLHRVDGWLKKVAAMGASVVELELFIDSPCELQRDGGVQPKLWRFDGSLHCWESLTCLSLFYIPVIPSEFEDLIEEDIISAFLLLDLGSVNMPCLQRLCLWCVQVDYVLEDLLKRCPELATLKLIECNVPEELRISSERLCMLDFFECQMHRGSVVVDTPGLRSLHVYGVNDDVRIENALKLEDVFLINMFGLGSEPDILANLVHVTTLTLSDATIKDIDQEHESLMFDNLKSLHIIMGASKEMVDNYLVLLSNFLQYCSFPVLEDLIIQFPLMIDTSESEEFEVVITAAFPNLRLVCIKEFRGLSDEIKFVQFLLVNAVRLDTLGLYMSEKAAGNTDDIEALGDATDEKEALDDTCGTLATPQKETKALDETDDMDDKLAALQKEIEALPEAREGLNILLGRHSDHLVCVPALPHTEFHREVSEYKYAKLQELLYSSWELRMTCHPSQKREKKKIFCLGF